VSNSKPAEFGPSKNFKEQELHSRKQKLAPFPTQADKRLKCGDKT